MKNKTRLSGSKAILATLLCVSFLLALPGTIRANPVSSNQEVTCTFHGQGGTFANGEGDVVLKGQPGDHIDIPQDPRYFMHTFARWTSDPHIPRPAIVLDTFPDYDLNYYAAYNDAPYGWDYAGGTYTYIWYRFADGYGGYLDDGWYWLENSTLPAGDPIEPGWSWYYFYPGNAAHDGGVVAQYQWVETDGKCYWVWARGNLDMTPGWLWLELNWDGGYWYYITNSYARADNSWIWDENTLAWYYCNQEGKMVRDAWVETENGWAYLDSEGKMLKDGWFWLDNAWHYFSNSGIDSRGWNWIDAAWYYLGDNGAMYANGWHWVETAWYYFGFSGDMWHDGWYWIDTAWYYLAPSGSMYANGWHWVDTDWYFFGFSGDMVHNRWLWDADKCYYLYDNGIMAKNYWIGEWWVGSDGAWV